MVDSFRLVLSTLTLICFALASNLAAAGSVFVLGDLTPVFGLNQRAHPGNVQLFENLRLESRDGSSVFILENDFTSVAAKVLEEFYTSRNNIVHVEGSIATTGLQGVGMLVMMIPVDAIPQEEMKAVKEYVKNSGDLLLIGELAPVARANEHLNKLLEELGSSVRIDMTKNALEEFSDSFAENSLVADVDSLKLGGSRVVNGGTPLAFTLVEGRYEPILSYELLYED